jgi:hypothetical protein
MIIRLIAHKYFFYIFKTLGCKPILISNVKVHRKSAKTLHREKNLTMQKGVKILMLVMLKEGAGKSW